MATQGLRREPDECPSPKYESISRQWHEKSVGSFDFFFDLALSDPKESDCRFDDKFDTEHSLSVSGLFSRVKYAIQASESDRHSLIELCARFDQNGDRRLNLSEFERIVSFLIGFEIKTVCPTSDHLIRLFREFDVEREGNISYFQFIRMIRSLAKL